MKSFPASMFPNAVEFRAVTYQVREDGISMGTYSSGVRFRASVQARRVDRLEVDGTVMSATLYDVFLPVDPKADVDDHFIWGERILASLGPAIDVGGLGSLWQVTCREVV